LVLILLLLFLGNLRAALVVAAILPLSALSTFLMMRQFGLSANLMSLGGLTIAIGLLVDAAVVVVENIEMQLADAHESKHRSFLPPLNVIYRAVCEVAVPVTAGMIIIMLVFIPLMTLQGWKEAFLSSGADHCLCIVELTDFFINDYSGAVFLFLEISSTSHAVYCC
jgi:cobalt-zinc-cadmium resistance protein CzcA